MNRLPKRISRILAVGDVPEDSVRRITRGEEFSCVYGSETQHQQLSTFCMNLTEWLKQRGLDLRALTEEELRELLTRHDMGVDE